MSPSGSDPLDPEASAPALTAATLRALLERVESGEILANSSQAIRLVRRVEGAITALEALSASQTGAEPADLSAD